MLFIINLIIKRYEDLQNEFYKDKHVFHLLDSSNQKIKIVYAFKTNR